MVNDSLAELKVSFQSTKSQFLKLLQPVSILRTSTSVKYSYQVYPRRNESINGSLIFQKDDEISAEISVNLGDDEDDVLSGVWNDSNWSWESDSAD